MTSKRLVLVGAVSAVVSFSATVFSNQAQAWAWGPATSPATTPTTRLSTRPTTAPARAEFPSPAQLLREMKEETDSTKKKLQIAYFDLGSMQLGEAPSSGISLFGGANVTSLHDLTQRLDKARQDKDVKAVLVTLNTGASISLAQAQELRAEFEQLRRDGKRIFVHADSYSTVDYVLASAATDVCVMPTGELFLPGVGVETMFYKGLLEKVGVKADYVQIGEYKGAEEPYTRSEPSDELKNEMDKLVKNLYSEVVDAISLSRGKSADDVRRLIDDAILPARQLKQQGYVDHLVDADGLRDLLKQELGDEINLVTDYGTQRRADIDLENPFSILTAINQRPEESSKPKIAIIYAEGVITDGEGEGGLLGGGGIGSEPIRRAMRMAARDEQVKAVVIRINSPGGSALASEVMWQAIRRVAKEKPVVISIGGMAASGGYYMACAGDYIVADPAGIVGSIGVVGGKFVLGGLYEKLGLTTFQFSQGRNAGLFSSTTEWDDRQRRMVRTWMKSTYDQFTDRVMITRDGRIRDIDKVARGRIFTAREAKDLGMVDALGGLETALSEAAKRAKLADGEWDTKVLPPAPTLADFLGGGSGSTMQAPLGAALRPGFGSDAAVMLSMLPPEAKDAVVHFVHMGQLLQDRPVVLLTPYTISVK